MNILMLSKACVVGAYQRKLEEIAARGVELTVVVPPNWRDERGVMPLEKKYTQGYRLVVAPMRFNGHFHLHYYPSLSHSLREARPDIVHIDEEPWDLVTFHALRNSLAVQARPLFFSWQNLLRRYPPPFEWFARYAFRHCTHAIAGMASVERVLRAKGYDGHVSVIPQFGVDPDIFCPCAVEQDARKARPYTLAYIGRLKHEKGVDVLLRAVAGLQGDWRVRVLGAGPEKEHLQQLATQLRIAERVQFDAPIPSTQMPDYYRQLDLCVLPSRRAPNWMEQFGRVLIEAMASGVPVIGSDSGDIPNVIGDAGLIFPEEDAEALRAQIERVRCDAPLQAQLQKCGRERVLEQFTQARVAEQTVGVYRQMLG
jgi:glycosyltransferase involved in cell wall biosynthesis